MHCSCRINDVKSSIIRNVAVLTVKLMIPAQQQLAAMNCSVANKLLSPIHLFSPSGPIKPQCSAVPALIVDEGVVFNLFWQHWFKLAY